MNIAVILPLYNDAAGKFKERFPKVLESMKNLRDVDGNWCWCLNAQRIGVAHLQEIEAKLEANTGHQLMSLISHYEPPISMARIREEAAQMVDKSWPDLYLSVDDDFVFRPGTAERYSQCIEYIAAHPDCGVIMCMGSFGGHVHGTDIIRTYNKTIWQTNRGQFLRNLKEEPWAYCEHDIQEVPGPFEDLYCVLNRVDRGYFTAKTFNVPVSNKNTRCDDRVLESIQKMGRYKLEEAMHHPDHQENIFQFIRAKYNDPNWDYWSRKFPGKLAARHLEEQ